MAGCRGKHTELVPQWASLLAKAFGVGFTDWLNDLSTFRGPKVFQISIVVLQLPPPTESLEDQDRSTAPVSGHLANVNDSSAVL